MAMVTNKYHLLDEHVRRYTNTRQIVLQKYEKKAFILLHCPWEG